MLGIGRMTRNMEEGKFTSADGGVYEKIWNGSRCQLKRRRFPWMRGDDVAHGGAYEGYWKDDLTHGDDECSLLVEQNARGLEIFFSNFHI
jgi:hypothetical protein